MQTRRRLSPVPTILVLLSALGRSGIASPVPDAPQAALFAAVAKADLAGVKAALKAGADPDSQDSEGRPALALAGLNGRLRDTVPSFEEAQARLDVMKLLLRNGASFPAGSGPYTYLDGLARQSVNDATYFRRYDVAELLIARGAPKESLNLWSAIRAWPTEKNARERRKLFDRMLARSDGVTRSAALFEAITSDDAPFFVTRLLDRGADPNRRNWDGHTPLTQAVVAKRADMVRLLQRRGADSRLPYVMPKSDYIVVHWREWGGKTPLQLAEAMGEERIAALLRDR